MRNVDTRHRPIVGWFTGLAMLLSATSAVAQATSLDDLVSGVVRIKTYINPDGRTVATLGRERNGSGIVIDADGLVLTIGYLMVEAHAAEVTTNAGRTVPATIVGYDHETGFGLIRATEPLKIKPLALGKSADLKESDPVLVASFGGASMVAPVRVVSRREFAGNWEYLLDDAIYTAPPHPMWSGAALINRDGKLVGVGSLVLSDVSADQKMQAGNVFVPIDVLPPILADLIAEGRSTNPPKPWLGVNADYVHGQLYVTRVTPGGPAEKAGLRHGAVIAGVAGEKPSGLSDFYRKVWARGTAGAVVPLDIEENATVRRVEIPSIDRLQHLRLRSTF